MPPLDLDAYVRDYLTLLLAVTSVGQPPEARAEQARQMRERGDAMSEAMAEGTTLDASGLILLHHRREAVRSAWRTFFEDWDVLVCPTALDVAFPHQTGDDGSRLITVDDREVPYLLNMIYPLLAVFPGQPATAFPAGLNSAGLPLGLQAMGPYLEDRTTLRFAQLLEHEWRGFEPPPGY
jgi:amidase